MKKPINSKLVDLVPLPDAGSEFNPLNKCWRQLAEFQSLATVCNCLVKAYSQLATSLLRQLLCQLRSTLTSIVLSFMIRMMAINCFVMMTIFRVWLYMPSKQMICHYFHSRRKNNDLPFSIIFLNVRVHYILSR